LGSSAFEKLETRGTLTKTKRFRPGEETDKGAHMVKLPKGAKPVNVSLPPKAQVAWRMFGKFVQARTGSDPELEDNLLKAHIRLRPEEYLAVAWMNTTFAAVGAVVAAFVIGLAQSLLTLWMNPQRVAIAIFALMIVVLIVRPRGFFGREGVLE